jgi:hypothetical protein
MRAGDAMGEAKRAGGRAGVALCFVLFGLAFAVVAFSVTEARPRRLHALAVGAVNLAGAAYLMRRSGRTPAPPKTC